MSASYHSEATRVMLAQKGKESAKILSRSLSSWESRCLVTVLTVCEEAFLLHTYFVCVCEECQEVRTSAFDKSAPRVTALDMGARAPCSLHVRLHH